MARLTIVLIPLIALAAGCGAEPTTTDGPPVGTSTGDSTGKVRLVRDVVEGNGRSPMFLAAVGDRLFFTADEIFEY